jgi:hypothetical protein
VFDLDGSNRRMRRQMLAGGVQSPVPFPSCNLGTRLKEACLLKIAQRFSVGSSLPRRNKFRRDRTLLTHAGIVPSGLRRE